jgi:copper chaperone CopZ
LQILKNNPFAIIKNTSTFISDLIAKLKLNNKLKRSAMRVFLLLFPLFLACQGPKTSSSKETSAPEATPSISYTLSVEGMTCTGCENTVKNAVQSVEGVSAVEASFEDELVSMSVTEAADTASIRQQIISSGYMPTGAFELKDIQ